MSTNAGAAHFDSVRHQAWIVAASTVVFFTSLGGPRLWDDDEPRNSQCAKEMLARGDWIVPTFNGTLRTDKPVLVYWLMMGAYSLFGANEYAARLSSAILGTGTALVTYRLGRRLFSAQAGLWAGLMLATSLMFVVSSRAATPDATLIFFSSLAMYAWIARPHTWWGHLPAYAAMGCAALAKGPVGVVLPLGVLGCYGLCLLEVQPAKVGPGAWPSSAASTNKTAALLRATLAWLAPARIWRAGWAMRPLTGLAVTALIAVPWYVAVGIQTDGEWLTGFLGRHNLSRFTQAMEGHSGPFFYYVPAIFVGFFPWSIFLGLAVVHAVRNLRAREQECANWQFLACWAGVYVGFFSLSSTKLPSYVLPAYPALALMTSAFLQHWRTAPSSVRAAPTIVALAAVAVVGAAVAIGLPIAARFVLPGEAWLGLLGVPLLVGGAVALWQYRRGRPNAVLHVLVAASIVFMAGLFGLASLRVSEHTNATSLTAKIRAASLGAKRPAIGTFRYSAPSLTYYAGQPILYADSTEDVGELFANNPHAFLITQANRLEELRSALPADVVELSRERRFLRRQDLVLLGRRPAMASGPWAAKLR